MGNAASAKVDVAVGDASDAFLHEALDAEDSEVWDALFSAKATHEALQQELPFDALERLCRQRPGNLQTAALLAVSTISQFMETRYKGPDAEVALGAARFITRMLPIILEDDILNEWCWEEHRLADFITYLNKDDLQQETSPKRGSTISANAGGGGGDGGHIASHGSPPASNSGGGQEFPVCLASILLHTAINLLFFPAICVDPAAPEHDDEYAPVPEHCYGIRDPSYIWKGGAGVGDDSVIDVSHLDANRLPLLRLLLVALSRPLYRPLPPAPPPSAAADVYVHALAASSGAFSGPSGAPLDPWARLAASRHLPFTAELFYSLINTALAPEPGSWTLSAILGGGSGGRGSRGGGGGQPSSVPEAALQLLLALLQHGSPYAVILRRLGVADPVDMPPEELAWDVRERAGGEPDYNCYRRCLWVLHGEDLAFVAAGVLRLLGTARAGGGGGSGGGSHEALLLLAAILDENPAFARYVCGSSMEIEDEEGETAGDGKIAAALFAEIAYLLDAAASSVLRAGAGSAGGAEEEDASPGEDVGLLILCTHVLLRLSEQPDFGIILDTAMASPSLPITTILPAFRGSLADALVLLACDVMAHPSLEFVCPALAGAVRNTIGISSVAAAEFSGFGKKISSDAPKNGIHAPPASLPGVTVGPAAANPLMHTLDLLTSRPSFLRSTPAGVCSVSLLLEAVGAAIAADYAGQAELVLAAVHHGGRVFNRLRYLPSGTVSSAATSLAAVAAASVPPAAVAASAAVATPIGAASGNSPRGAAAAAAGFPTAAIPLVPPPVIEPGPWLGVEPVSRAQTAHPATGWPVQRVLAPLLDILGPRLEAALPPPPPPAAAGWNSRGGGGGAVADEESALQDIESDDNVAALIAAVRDDVFGEAGGPARGGRGGGAVFFSDAAAAVPTVARLEGWHFSYLWSVIFVRTQEEGLLPPRAVRLFELVHPDSDEEQEDSSVLNRKGEYGPSP